MISKNFVRSVGVISLLLLLGILAHLHSISQNWVANSFADGRDCLPLEIYDPSRNVCVLSCNSIESCAIVDSSYLSLFNTLSTDQLNAYFGFDLSNATTTFFDWNRPSLTEILLGNVERIPNVPHVTYKIDQGRMGEPVENVGGARLDPRDSYMWGLFSLLAPPKYKRLVSKYQVVTSSDSDFGGAYTKELDVSGNNWLFSVEKTQFFTTHGVPMSTGRMIHTIVHEMGHLVTLGSRQIDSLDLDCRTISFMGGCVRAGTYLDSYTKEFWPESRPDRGEELAAYQPDHFVSSYAAENPAEDIAESWTAFVLLNRQKGDTIASRKINFFYRYAELVRAREYIRSQLSRIK